MSKSPRSHTGPACAHHEFQSGRVKLEERFPEATMDSLKAKAPQNHHHRTLVQQLRPPAIKTSSSSQTATSAVTA